MAIWWQSDGSQCTQKVHRVTSLILSVSSDLLRLNWILRHFLDTDYKKKIKEVT